jgi:regulator of protease activity HflC (stomatin/prohibitin superfamily)
VEPLLIVLLIFIAICLFDSLFIVNSQTAAIIERLGKYHATAHEGLNFKLPFIDRIVIRRNLKIVQQDIEVETKTRDNVFVRTKVSVQYRIIRDKVHDSYYRLSDPIAQIESYIFDVVRSEIPKLSLDEVFVNKDSVALAVKESLEDSMDDFGFMIIKTLITDIDPDEKVKQSMNEINAAERLRDAAMAKAEAEKIGIVMQAEAHAESKRLQGLGMANQRKEIASGFSTEFPNADFKLLDSSLKNGTLTLKFSEVPGFTTGGSCRVGILTQEILKTVRQFPQVKKIELYPDLLFQP